jgi:acetoin utilization protein AcuB
MLIRDWMTSTPIVIKAKESVTTAQDLMRRLRIRHLPVVEGDALVGMLTDRDVRTVLPSPATSLAAGEIRFLLDRLTVDKVMTHPVVTVRPDDALADAVRLVLEKRIGALPVTERGRLVGIITETDLLRALGTLIGVVEECPLTVCESVHPRKILVPLDGSAGSEAVLPTIAEIARAEDADVLLLYVARVPEEVISDNRVVAYVDQETARIEVESRAYLKRVSSRLRGIAVEFAVRFGDPAAEIVDEAEKNGATLIAMATHRRSGLARVVKGSIAEEVERSTAVPVLLVQYGEPAVA